MNPPEIRITFAQYFDQELPSSYPHSLDVNHMQELYPAGELQAHERLDSFIKNKATRYHQGRDVPQIEGTSGLSPFLAAGALSARQCVVAARTANKGRLTTGDEGLRTWIKEVGWRVKARKCTCIARSRDGRDLSHC